MELIFFVVGLVVFDLAAWRWGEDSRDGIDSPEWKRRHVWRGFVGKD